MTDPARRASARCVNENRLGSRFIMRCLTKKERKKERTTLPFFLLPAPPVPDRCSAIRTVHMDGANTITRKKVSGVRVTSFP